MLAKEARRAARQWTDSAARRIPGCVGVVLHGSINWLEDGDVLASTSDLDLLLVMEDGFDLSQRRKFLYQGVMLELTHMPLRDLQPPEHVLGTHYLAGSFYGETVLWDASGYLTELRNYVTAHYAQRCWVERRCRSVQEKISGGYPPDPAWPLHRKVTAWIFAAGLCSHVILVAGLANPTVRTRLAATQHLLADLNRLDIQEELLDLFRSRELHKERIQTHTDHLGLLFDMAIPLVHGEYPFAADITPSGREIAISGNLQMIHQGLHRETVFWLGASFARCLQVITEQGSEAEQQQAEALMQTFLDDLGVGTPDRVLQAHGRVLQQLPRIWDFGQWIMDQHPKIWR